MRTQAAGDLKVKRAATAVLMTGATWLGISLEAHAQCQVLPVGPMAVKAQFVPAVPEYLNDDNQIYPGRTMGGGTRILRSIPPPSFLKRRKE